MSISEVTNKPVAPLAGGAGGDLANIARGQDLFRLQMVAHRAMIQRGFFPDFSPQAIPQLDAIGAPATVFGNPLMSKPTQLNP